MPIKPDELRRAWLRALHREGVDELKVVFVCLKHFKEDVEFMHTVLNGDGKCRDVPRSRPNLKDGAVPAILPVCSSYHSSHSTSKRSSLSFEDKDDELLNQQ